MSRKIQSPRALKKICQRLRRQRKRIVFTNGCFDLIHAGHIRYLTQAKKMGDVLVVALNSDRSVKMVKGKQRPIVPLKERAEVMAALSMVDFVTHFHKDNPHDLIAALIPHILVKGGDWKPAQIIGSDVVLKNGGKVKSLRYHKGKSTTNVIQTILQNYR